jgi:hypothetical protein
MIRFYLVCLPYWIFVDYIFVRLSLRVVTIEVIIDYPVAGQIGPKQNRPQVKSVPGQIVPSQIGPSQIGTKSNRPLV